MACFFLLIISFAICAAIQVAVAKIDSHFIADDCCLGEKNTTFDQERMAIFEECKKELGFDNGKEEDQDESGSKEHRKKNHEKFVCISECIFKKFNIIGDNKNVSKEEYKAYLDKCANTEAKKAVVDDIFKNCTEAFEKHSKHNGPSGDGEEKCSKNGIFLAFCAEKGFFLSCPVDQRDNKGICQNRYKRMENGHGPGYHRGKHGKGKEE